MNNKLNFLITGGGGYLGSVLVPMLLAKEHTALVVDRFFWGKDVFLPHKSLRLIEADTRSLLPDYFEGVDVVLDLAALSNDPIAQLNPKRTMDINYHARVKTALVAKTQGVKKYILASSCSVYGFCENILDETSLTSPKTTYAKASLLAEQNVLPLSSKDFSVTVLRQGTLYGISPRMRFDVALNTMVSSLFNHNRITIEGGDQWRPIVHVKDSADAFIKIAEAEPKKINGHIFNVGSFDQNYQVKDLAQLIAKTLHPAANIVFNNTQKDIRSYRVSFEKIKNRMGYQAKITPENGAREVYHALVSKQISDNIQTRTIDWYKHLLSKNPNLFKNA